MNTRLFSIERKTRKEMIIKFSPWTKDVGGRGRGEKIQNNNNKYDHVNVEFGALFFIYFFPQLGFRFEIYIHTYYGYIIVIDRIIKDFFYTSGKNQFTKNTILTMTS